MRKWIYAIGLFCSLAVAQAAIYETLDSHGNPVFSDKKSRGAKKLKLPPVQKYSSKSVQAGEIEKTTPDGKASDQAYTLVAISLPKDNDNYWDAEGLVDVQVVVEPGIKESDYLSLVLDGEEITKSISSTRFMLRNVYRGTHKLVAVINTKEGKEIIASPPVTFHMHRPTVKKTKPKPQ